MPKKRNRHQNPQPFIADENASVASKKRSKLPKQHQTDEELISSGMSSKILKEALAQQREIQDEAEPRDANGNNNSLVFTETFAEAEEAEEDEIDNFGGFSETRTLFDSYDEEINEEDERILEAFLRKDAGPQRTLADLIVEKIKQKDANAASELRPLPKLDNSIIDLYKGVGKLLSSYTAGKIPKAFKHIPSMQLWEDVLYLTEPENWSPNGLYQATRIFASNLGAKKAERFYRLVLLPRVREDILKNKRLHFALYQALKKSLYKPAAFFKGILFPLCESRTCNLREAVIIGSILQKVSIPPLHSSVALLKLAEMEYGGTTSYFIKLLLEKKYALPHRVLDATVAHFMRFLEDARIMPVIWHQSLLAFVQRYKNDLRKEDKDSLRNLLEKQKHKLVTPEIRRELNNSRNRGEKEDDLMLISSSVSVINKTIEEDRFDIPEVPMEED
ncbi:bystin [Juglans microcarpa x Juglans regia]|uniref:bystin n=1 Tax=Juglans microcarpa x Juglans regia TaxID=2249226 RepID=UPI001B7E0525|nr:bystin [Juglans microcarpa x Juglans regia]